MDQRGEVDHLDDDRRLDVGFRAGWPKQLAASATSVGRRFLPPLFSACSAYGTICGIKNPRLPGQLLRHRMEKRLHRFHNQFPGTGGV